MVVAALGIVVNGGTALLFMRGNKEDLNIRGAYLHMISDAAISFGVVVTGLVILKTGWLWLDPAVSIVIAIAIIAGTWGLLRDSIALALHAVPAHIDVKLVKAFLAGKQGVKEVHDLHIWGMSTNTSGLSAHLLMPAGHPGDGFIRTVAQELEERFRINHATLQIEIGDKDGECPLAPDHVI
jgi:cobalt-zinc-cadmium efflux system protein